MQDLYNKIMHAGFKVYKYKIIIYYKGELQGNAHEEHGFLRITKYKCLDPAQ